MQDGFVELLKSKKGLRVYLKPYAGNSGDELIWMGNEVLVQRLGLNRVVNPNKAQVIVWPGGNPTMWENNLNGWKECWTRWPKAEFIVAPATFQDSPFNWRQMLNEASAPIAGIFARDAQSLKNLQKPGLTSTIPIGWGHDPALQLRDTDWMAQHREAGSSDYVLASFRGDHEAASEKRGLSHYILSLMPSPVQRKIRFLRYKAVCKRRLETVKKLSGSSQPVLECDASTLDFQLFVECIRAASSVHTDRLHCMILAAMLDKPIFAYPTAYGKIEAVYEASLKPWARVNFVTES